MFSPSKRVKNNQLRITKSYAKSQLQEIQFSKKQPNLNKEGKNFRL